MCETLTAVRIPEPESTRAGQRSRNDLTEL